MSEPGLTAQTVLLVEDNLDNRVIYSMVLLHAGYVVIEAVDGEEGAGRAREHHPDVILMDISIPKIDGYTATRMLKADASTAAIPIIALTAHVMDGAEQRACEAGCDAYLWKPAVPRRVLEEVRRFIGPANG